MRISDWSSDVCSSVLGGVDLDPVESRGDRIARRVNIIRDDAGNLFDRQRPRFDIRLPARIGVRLPRRGRRRRGNRLAAIEEAWMDDSAHMPELREYPSRSEEHTSELQSLMRISYAVVCLKKKKNNSTSI